MLRGFAAQSLDNSVAAAAVPPYVTCFMVRLIVPTSPTFLDMWDDGCGCGGGGAGWKPLMAAHMSGHGAEGQKTAI